MFDPTDTDAAEDFPCRTCIQPAIDHSMQLTLLLRDATAYADRLRTRFADERSHAPPPTSDTLARSN
ncbi:hypothetical protein [Nitratidesulfovibrio liaohensis]|uniref:hypothetical protein n=1 Tax=Nitratidesulfovibrio liaohensis TaxID=2604158 RepID=UPI001421A0B5|nr:hypothetical protein [Nitratidesulfovibrio liaohensis]NHZ47704.1 hypothetical protein [Nitratidesulfovibrio liaohensis]